MARVAAVARGMRAALAAALRRSGSATDPGNEKRAGDFHQRNGIAAFDWDVAEYDQCVAGMKRIQADLGPVDIVVNDAGNARRRQEEDAARRPGRGDRDDRGPHPRRPLGQARGDRAPGTDPGSRRNRLHHRPEPLDQRRPAHVLDGRGFDKGAVSRY